MIQYQRPIHYSRESHYIGGQWLHGEGEPFVSKNPADDTVIWQGSEASVIEISKACKAANLAFPYWASLDFATRANYIKEFAKQIAKKQAELSYLISLETGKPLWEAKTETNAVLAKVDLSIQAYLERNAEKHIQTTEATACLRYKPHGVVVVLGAFNFPAHLSNGHIIPALLAGNTVIYKPSELAPAVAQFIMHCWHEAGLPQGVINCVQGAAETGKLLLKTDIQGVYFTGCYQTGLAIHRQFSERPEVILALEMGGNNPLVIDTVANTEAALYYTLLSTLLTAGQRCSCARRVLIADNHFGDCFLELLLHHCQSLKVSHFKESPEPFMGPVISHEQACSHLNTQQTLLENGGKPLLMMTLLAKNSGLLSPGLIDMTNASPLADEEIFAPLIQIHRYQDFEQALVLANNTRYGLTAGLLSDNFTHYQQFYRTIRAGIINWNRPTTGALSSLPFGGIGHSGNHRPSGYFAADYCSYPIASLEKAELTMPEQLLPGILK